MALTTISSQALMLLTLTFVSTIVLGIELGLLVGLGISVFIIVKNSAFPHIALLGRIPNTETYRDIAFHSEALTIPVCSAFPFLPFRCCPHTNDCHTMVLDLEQKGHHHHAY